jgi:hypothetical protein
MLLTAPPNLNYFEGDSLDVLCKNVTSPDITNQSYEIQVKGHPIKLPGRSIQNQEITVTFYVDEYYKIKQFFQNWILAIDNRATVPRNGNTSSLVNSIKNSNYNMFGTIELIGRDFQESLGKPIQFIFENVFPTSVSGVEFDSTNKDSISEMTVTFSYYRYITNSAIDGWNNRETQENLDLYLDEIKG